MSEKLTILGSGTMGHSIALNAAWRGLNVKVYGLDKNDINIGETGIIEKLKTLVENNLLDKQEIELIMDKITFFTSFEKSIDASTFIIEAVPEDIDLKKKIFRKLDAICDPSVVLASNTSGFSPSLIASSTNHPERVIVMHFWNPAHLIPLVEIVRGDETNDSTVQRATKLVDYMKKKPILVKKEIPGFVANRLQFALLREAQYLLEEGVATLEDIDLAVTYSIGRRLSVTGPFLSADMGGLDVFASISDYLFTTLSKADKASPTIVNLINQKKLGNKSGAGYYSWDHEFSHDMNNRREAELIRFLKQDLVKQSPE